jgi:hypothetical protein
MPTWHYSRPSGALVGSEMLATGITSRHSREPATSAHAAHRNRSTLASFRLFPGSSGRLCDPAVEVEVDNPRGHFFPMQTRCGVLA